MPKEYAYLDTLSSVAPTPAPRGYVVVGNWSGMPNPTTIVNQIVGVVIVHRKVYSRVVPETPASPATQYVTDDQLQKAGFDPEGMDIVIAPVVRYDDGLALYIKDHRNPSDVGRSVYCWGAQNEDEVRLKQQREAVVEEMRRKYAERKLHSSSQ